MSLLSSIADRIRRRTTASRRGERDAPADPTHAHTQETGGAPVPDAQDQNSSTGTTENEEFVGRASGDESGDVGLSGGEARAGKRADGRTGAARDD